MDNMNYKTLMRMINENTEYVQRIRKTLPNRMPKRVEQMIERIEHDNENLKQLAKDFGYAEMVE